MTNESSPNEFAGFIEQIKKWAAPFVAVGVFVFGLGQVFEQVWKNLTWVMVAGVSLLWLFLFWVYTSKVKHEILDSTDSMPRVEERPQFPKWRKLALAGMILLPIITTSWFARTKYIESLPSQKILVLVANFQGPEQKHLVTPTVIDKLREATKGMLEVEIQALNTEITGQDGPEVARAKGKEKKASIVIWGFYDDSLNATVHIEIVSERKVLYQVIGGREGKSSYRAPANASNPSLIVKENISGDMGLITLLLLGSIRYEAKDLDGAILRFSKAIEQETTVQLAEYQTRLFYFRGHAYSHKGEIDRAITDYTKAIELDQKYAAAYNDRGLAYSDKGEKDRAISDYNKAIELDQKYATAYNNRGLAYGDKGDLDQAIADFTKAIELAPKSPAAYNNRGNAYWGNGDQNKAIADFTKAIDLDQKYADAYNNRGLAYWGNSDQDKAIADFTKAIDLDQKYAAAYNNRGNAYFQKGEKDRAIADYTKAIELDQKYATAYINRGNAYSQKGEKDRPIADYTKAIELDPKYAAAYYNRGRAYSHKGEINRAITDYTKAIELNQKYAAAYHNRGHAYSRKGEKVQAIADFQKSLELSTNHQDRECALQQLRKLGAQ